MRYIYTNHVIDRLRERFNFNWDWDNKTEIYRELDKILKDTKDDKSYLNNTRFMLNLLDLHGFDSRYEFRSHIALDILFVTIIEKDKRIVKTCYPLTNSKFIKRKGFKKSSKKKNTPTSKSRRSRSPVKEFEAMQAHWEREKS